MTDDSSMFDRIVDDETRRSFLKKGTAATAGLAATGLASAQNGTDGNATDGNATDAEDGDIRPENWPALVFVDSFHPNARFAITSGVVEWTPNYNEVADSPMHQYNTRMIRWLNSGEVVPLYVGQAEEQQIDIGEYDSELGYVVDDDDPNQPQLYQMDQDWTPFEANTRMVEVNVSRVDEETEDRILEEEDWWRDGGNGAGTATRTPTQSPMGNQSG